MVRFSTKVELTGDTAKRVKDILDTKKTQDNRKSYNNTIETIILEWDAMKNPKNSKKNAEK